MLRAPPYCNQILHRCMHFSNSSFSPHSTDGNLRSKFQAEMCAVVGQNVPSPPPPRDSTKTYSKSPMDTKYYAQTSELFCGLWIFSALLETDGKPKRDSIWLNPCFMASQLVEDHLRKQKFCCPGQTRLTRFGHIWFGLNLALCCPKCAIFGGCTHFSGQFKGVDRPQTRGPHVESVFSKSKFETCSFAYAPFLVSV